MKRIIEQIKTESESADYCCNECAKLLSNAMIGFIEDAFEPLPEPTCEGWWWLICEHNNYKVTECVEVYQGKDELYFEMSGIRFGLDDITGKWIRAITPESEG